MRLTLIPAVVCALTFLMPSLASAQQPLVEPPPDNYTLDARGVDLVRARYVFSTDDVVIGPPDTGLAYTRTFIGGFFYRDDFTGTITMVGSQIVVSIGESSDVFNVSGTTYTPVTNGGQTLVRNATDFVYTMSDGSVASFSRDLIRQDLPPPPVRARMTSLRRPNGEEISIFFETVHPEPGEPQTFFYARPFNVRSNRGYRLLFDYAAANIDPGGINDLDWLRITRVVGVNATEETCQTIIGGSCTLSRNWPSMSYLPGSAQDQSGRITSFINSASGFQIRTSGSGTTNVVEVQKDSTFRVTAVTIAGSTWTYAYSTAGSTRTTTISGPAGGSEIAVVDLNTQRLTSLTDEQGRTTSYGYDAQGRVTSVTEPGERQLTYVYGARGNLISSQVGSTGITPVTPLTTTYTYPTTCTNPVTCNQPTAVVDPLGGQTDITYDAVHGGALTVTQTAPATGAVRPQTRYAYADRQAWFMNELGVLAPGTPITLPVEVSTCATGSACDGTADEILTTIVYGAAGVANNLSPTQVTTGSGDGILAATTTATWTVPGDVETVDGPLPGTEDTTHYRYDDARQMTGMVAPDPDGAGPRVRTAMRTTYDLKGQPTLVEQGTVTGPSDPAWAAFSSLIQAATVYDPYGRPITSLGTAGGVTYAAGQASYDPAGRLDCTVVRMNPATFGALPGSAFTPAPTGGFGPDRITAHAYNNADDVLSVTHAFGLPEAITEQATYDTAGRVQTLIDGRGNTSQYDYDRLNRIIKLSYPNATGGGVSATDYEETTYDAYGRAVAIRNRAGQVTTLGYDNLGRVTAVDAPAGTMSVAYTYDNLGRVLTSAGNSQALTHVWDPLSRLTSETGPLGSMAYQYDAAGRQTRITWPDTNYAQYDRSVDGNLAAIRYNGVDALVQYSYNQMGQTTSIQRANGTTTNYAYDPVGRMTGLSHDMAGTAADISFGYGWNPAGQIVSRTVSNPSYLYVPTPGATSYTTNGLNQATGVDGSPVTYDANQNTATALGAGYGYDAANRLVSATIAGDPYTFSYDPAGRLFAGVGGRFQYVGDQLVGEYDASGYLFARHVPGPGLDRIVATYNGSYRSQHIADERGSIIGEADALGTVHINRYDDYGVAIGTGRFQYTGQAWLAPGLYNYRARAYAPELGRFLQADPIGYQAGMNLYGYVGADPVNLDDPSGLTPQATAPRRPDCTRPGQTNCVLPTTAIGDVTVTGTRDRRLSFGGRTGGIPPEANERCLAASRQRIRTERQISRGLRNNPNFWNNPTRLQNTIEDSRRSVRWLEDVRDAAGSAGGAQTLGGAVNFEVRRRTNRTGAEGLLGRFSSPRAGGYTFAAVVLAENTIRVEQASQEAAQFRIQEILECSSAVSSRSDR